MGTTVKVRRTIEVGGVSLSQEETLSVQSLVTIDEIVADGVTDEELLLAVDQSTMRVLYLLSDQDLTIETNGGGSPPAVDTIALSANVPLVWTANDPAATNPITADITSIFKTNASGSAATLRGYIGFGDPT